MFFLNSFIIALFSYIAFSSYISKSGDCTGPDENKITATQSDSQTKVVFPSIASLSYSKK